MNQELPPPNRALTWYRFMLWMMPTCIAITTVFAMGWVRTALGLRGYPTLVLWFALNLASTIGIGMFESRFNRRWDGTGKPLEPARVVKFVFLQFITIPAIVLALIMVIDSL